MKYFPIITLSLLSLVPGIEAQGENEVDTNPVFAKADCITLLDSTAVSVQESGSGSFAIYKKFKVQTLQGGVANHVIKYDYDPLTAYAEFKQATIYRAGGDIVNIDVTQACDYAAPARAIYWGARQIMLELGRLYPGDVVEYKIEKKGFTYALLAGAENEDESRFIPPMRGQFYDIVPFWVAEPTLRKVYKLTIPKEKEIQFHFYQGDCSSSMHYENGKKAYTFVIENAIPVKQEPNMVNLFDLPPNGKTNPCGSTKLTKTMEALNLSPKPRKR